MLSMRLMRRGSVMGAVMVALFVYCFFSGKVQAANQFQVDTDGTLTTSLVSYWKMEDATDFFGSDGMTNNNGLTFGSGKVNNAGIFMRSSSEFLSHADDANLSTGNINYTIAAWVKLASKPAGDEMSIVTKWNTNQFEYNFLYSNVEDRFIFEVCTDGTPPSLVQDFADNLGSPATDTWYFVVGIHDATDNLLKISVNNGSFDTVSATGAIDGTSAVEIGNAANDITYWNGSIDEVGFWKKILSAQEIPISIMREQGRR